MRVWNWATTSKREAKDPAQRRRVRTPIGHRMGMPWPVHVSSFEFTREMPNATNRILRKKCWCSNILKKLLVLEKI